MITQKFRSIKTPISNSLYLLLLVEILSIFLLYLSLKNNNFGNRSFLLWISSLFILFYIAKTIQKVSIANSIPKTAIILIFISTLFRLVWLANPNYVYFHGDEAIISRNAQLSFENGLKHFNWNFLGSEKGTLNQLPALWYFIDGFIIKIFGPSLSSIKIFSLITDSLLSLFIYLILRKQFRHQLALIGLSLYLTFPIAIHFSVTGYQNIQPTLLLFLGFFIIFSNYLQPENLPSKLILSGIVIGLSFYFYLSALINPLIIIFYLLFSKNNLLYKLKLTLLFTVSFVITIIPYIYYSLFQYNFLQGRSQAIVFSPSLNYWQAQFNQYFLAFLPSTQTQTALSGLFYPDLPILSHWLALVLLLIGIIYLFKSRTDLGRFILLVLVLTSLTGGLLTNNPPAAQRLIHLYPAIIITTVAGMFWLLNSHQKLLWPCALIFLSLNIYSFATKNIPIYYRRQVKDIIAVNQQVSAGDIIVLTGVHKIDQLYYLSLGKIISQPFSCLSSAKWIFFDSDTPPDSISCPNSKIVSTGNWSTTFDRTSLGQIIPLN